MGHSNYLSMMKLSNVIIGNSSSGILEAPYFEKPVVNIGDRQRGGKIKMLLIVDQIIKIFIEQ